MNTHIVFAFIFILACVIVWLAYRLRQSKEELDQTTTVIRYKIDREYKVVLQQVQRDVRALDESIQVKINELSRKDLAPAQPQTKKRKLFTWD